MNYLPKNGIIAELGVDKGDFSNKIITITHPKKLYLIDIWDSEVHNRNKMLYVKKRFKEEINAGQVIVIRGASEKELGKFENGYFDWVYIDTSHNYKQTIKELDLCRIKVKDGGIIAGHDYCQGNINEALAYGVVQAVNQFCIEYDWELIYLTHETDRTLSFAIKKIN
ncbi:MAG: class I SAM-dependent methyltransferase [Promethearchaeota archaeon]